MDATRLTIVAVPVGLIEILWDRIKPHLDKAMEFAKGECTSETVKVRALKGDTMFITVNLEQEIVAVISVMLDSYDTGKQALIVGSIGSASDIPMEEWFNQAFNVLKGIALDLGCTEIRGHAGRQGWVKKLKNTGWKEAYVTFIHEVS